MRGADTKGGLDQSILDEIGVESSDSDDDDTLPVPSIYSKTRVPQMPRSKSFGCFTVAVKEEDGFASVNPAFPSPKFQLIDREPAESQPPQSTSMRRSMSMSSLQKSRSDYNRAVGEALANSPKKQSGRTENDLAIMDQLLADL